MGKKSTPAPPPAPDYTAAAERSAQSSQEAQTRADWANRPNQVTPWGTTSWDSVQETDPATGLPVTRWTQRTQLDPRSQRALDDQFAVQEGMTDAAKGLIGRATSQFNSPFDMSRLTEMTGIDPSQLGDYSQLDTGGLPNLPTGLDRSNLPGLRAGLDTQSLGDMPDAGFGGVEQVQKAMMSRMAPDLLRRREGEIQRLKAQGLEEGSRAWSNAMEGIDRAENDASMQAVLGANQAYGDIFNRGLSKRQQLVGEQGLDAQLRSGARSQLTGEQLDDFGMASGARGQIFGERDRATSMANQLRQQKFGEQMQRAQLTGQQRQQQVAEQAYLRSLPLNELNSLLNGNQVSMPQMPGFSASQSAGGVDYLGATGSQYRDAMSGYNAMMANRSNRTSGLLGLAGRVGGSFFGPIGTAAGGAFADWLGS